MSNVNEKLLQEYEGRIRALRAALRWVAEVALVDTESVESRLLRIRQHAVAAMLHDQLS